MIHLYYNMADFMDEEDDLEGAYYDIRCDSWRNTVT